QPPDRPKACMRYEQTAVFIQRHSIRSTQSSMQVRKHSYLRYDAALLERNPPYLLRAGDGDQEVRHARIDHDSVRTGNGVDKAAQYAAGRVSIHSTAGVLQSGLSLIGEVQVAGSREHQIVDPLEP